MSFSTLIFRSNFRSHVVHEHDHGSSLPFLRFQQPKRMAPWLGYIFHYLDFPINLTQVAIKEILRISIYEKESACTSEFLLPQIEWKIA